MSDVTDSDRLIHVLGAVSHQAEEEVAAESAVLRSWGYDVRAIGPLTRDGRRRIGSAGVPTHNSPEPSGDSAGAGWSDARDLARTIADNAPSLIHAHGFRAAFAGLLARRGMSPAPPVVISPHLLPHRLHEDPRLGLRRRGYRWILDRSHAIVIASETQRDDLCDLSEIAGEGAELVPYPRPIGTQPDTLDLGRRRKILGITQSAVVIGCVVEGLAEGALETYMDAAATLCMEYPSLEFALIGRDVDRDLYHDLAHERGLFGAAVFVDPGERFRRAISALNILVTPQRGWPSGMLALQALAADVGVVAIEDGEVAEMLMGSPYVTIAPADGPSALGEAIIRRLRAAAQLMEPDRSAATHSVEASSLLVSKDFYDTDSSWATPGAREEAQSDTDETVGVARFDPTRAARALIALYHRLLDGS